jgi:hypothetical protein
MDAAVDLDHQPGIGAVEVDDENSRLAAGA